MEQQQLFDSFNGTQLCVLFNKIDFHMCLHLNVRSLYTSSSNVHFIFIRFFFLFACSFVGSARLFSFGSFHFNEMKPFATTFFPGLDSYFLTTLVSGGPTKPHKLSLNTYIFEAEKHFIYSIVSCFVHFCADLAFCSQQQQTTTTATKKSTRISEIRQKKN